MPDDRVCYVGKGSGRRMYTHRRYAKQPPSRSQLYLYRGLSELLICGKDFKPRKVFETDSELEALAEEKRRIKFYGLENLLNWDTCHNGPLARDMKEARRQAMSKARREYVANLRAEKGYGLSPEVAAKISASSIGRRVSAETCSKLSASLSARYGGAFTAEHRSKLSEAAKRRAVNPASIAAMAAANMGIAKDTTVARLSRSRVVYAIKSPNGAQFYGFSNGIVRLLGKIGLATTTFYRAVSSGAYCGWGVVSAKF